MDFLVFLFWLASYFFIGGFLVYLLLLAANKVISTVVEAEIDKLYWTSCSMVFKSNKDLSSAYANPASKLIPSELLDSKVGLVWDQLGVNNRAAVLKPLEEEVRKQLKKSQWAAFDIEDLAVVKFDELYPSLTKGGAVSSSVELSEGVTFLALMTTLLWPIVVPVLLAMVLAVMAFNSIGD